MPEPSAAESARWRTDSPDLTGSAPSAGPQNDEDWLDALIRDAGMRRRSSAPATERPHDPTATEERPPWELELNRAPWDSGPQPPVTSPEEKPAPGEGPKSAWGTDAKSAWGTGALPAVRTGPLPASRTGAQPVSGRTSDQPAGRTGAQPTFTPTGPPPTFTPTGPQPTFTPAGTQPAFTPSSGQPDGGPGTQPVLRTPWESGDWGKAPDWDAVADNRDASPAPSDTSDRDQTTDRDAAPAAAPPAKADKPERHSHRGGKHGKPSRWRGAGGRSGGDGES